MDLLKNHYEKIILGVVLLLLAVVAGYLPFEVSNVRSRLEQSTQSYERAKVEPIPELNLSTNETVAARANRAARFEFGRGEHGLFTPSGTWRRGPGGIPVPPPPTGVAGLVVTNISPLTLEIKYQGVSTGGAGSVRYRFFVKDESSTNRATAKGRIVIQGPGMRSDVLVIKDHLGPPENPEGFNLELAGLRKNVTVTREKAHTEVVGYAADLWHPGEGRTYRDQKQGGKVVMGGTTYNIVAVSEGDVTIEDDKTKRRTVVPSKSAP